MSLPATMQAVVLEAPFKVAVKQVPVPTLRDDGDILIKTTAAGLCGSDLHLYRGHLPTQLPTIVGHEAIGRIVQVGSGVKQWKVGDDVIVPFTATCGDCFYCSKGQTSRCVKGITFGVGRGLDGCQAEYVRVPMADSFVFRQPNDVSPATLLLMADILPTGYFVASGAKRLIMEGEGSAMSGNLAKDVEREKSGVCVVVGCGPVGLCAISSAVRMFDKVFATDLAPHRLEAARRHGAVALPEEELQKAILEATDGRGADAACEVVGHSDALLKCMQLVRPYGVVSSCGVHSQHFEVNAVQFYLKNLRFQFGQCSVPTHFPGALEVLRDNKDLFATFIEHRVVFDEAPDYYQMFEKNKIGKTVFESVEKA